MEIEFVTYEQALELKELGFDEPCLSKFYTKPNCKMFGVDEKGRHYTIKNTPKKLYTLGEHFVLNDSNVINAPLYQQAFRWFREKYILHSTITSISQEYWQWHITRPGESLGKLYNEDFYTFEEAELECLKKLIEIVKTNKTKINETKINKTGTQSKDFRRSKRNESKWYRINSGGM